MPADPPTKARSLWLWVILAFLVLIAAWSVMITIAVKHGPKKIEIETEAVDSPHGC